MNWMDLDEEIRSREEGEIGSESREKGDLLPCSSPLSVLGKKIEKLRVISGVILVFALMTTTIKKLCNCNADSSENLSSKTLLKPPNIICQGKTCHRKLVIHTRDQQKLSMTLVEGN